ncbi:MAG: PspA/IM30 family protein [Candidatus Marinimicrobia bacterium]|nr:PspA/IM30 family protein [Candidatus Neomarinimicrobiota bacterium]
MANMIRANVNALIESHEDPVKMAKLLEADLEATIVEAREELASVIAKEVRAGRELDDKKGEVDRWQKRAVKAAQNGQKNRVATAIAAKQREEQVLEILKKAWAKQLAARERLEKAIETLLEKLADVKSRLTALEATVAAADTLKQVAEAERIIGTADFDDGALGRWEDKAQQRLDEMTARVEIFARDEDEDWKDLDEGVSEEVDALMAEYAPQKKEKSSKA